MAIQDKEPADILSILPDMYHNLELPLSEGNSFHILFDISDDKCLYISPEIRLLTGRKDQWYIGRKSAYFLKRILHPLDFHTFYLDIILTRPHKSRLKCNKTNTFSFDTKTYCMRIHHIDGNWIHTNGELIRIYQSEFEKPNLIIANFQPLPRNETFIQCPTKLLTTREKLILQLIGNGASSKIIAKQLCISEETVVTHRKNLILKFRVKNSAELIKMAMRHHQIS